MIKPLLLALMVVLVTAIGAHTTVNLRHADSEQNVSAQVEEFIQSSNATWAKFRVTDKNRLTISGKTADGAAASDLLTGLHQIEGLQSITSRIVVSEPMTADECQQAVDSSLHDNILFDDTEHYLLQDSYPVLASIADTLRLCPVTRMLIVSHTDNAKTVEINQLISRIRSENIMSHLIEAEGLKDITMAAIGMGASYPLVLNDSPANRAINERVEIIIR